MRVGDTIAGKYSVTHVLGEGGMGVVYRARHTQLAHDVAIKVVRAEFVGDANVVTRFQREAQAAASLRSPHVARTMDVGVLPDGRPFMVLEFLEGNDLGAELERRGQLPVAEAVRWVLQACEGIAEAHARKIVHRDLKPENLFLAQEGRSRIVKILDFGISRVMDDTAARLTQTESCFGTPLYMSPEQMLSPKDTDERTDVWALGVILYELIVGEPPFDGETFAAVSIAVAGSAPVPMSKRRSDVPAGLDEIVRRALEKDMEDRFASVVELADALAPYTDQSVRADTTAPFGTPPAAVANARTLAAAAMPRVPMKPARRPRTWAWIVGSMTLMLAIGGVTFAAVLWAARPTSDVDTTAAKPTASAEPTTEVAAAPASASTTSAQPSASAQTSASAYAPVPTSVPPRIVPPRPPVRLPPKPPRRKIPKFHE